MDSLICTITLLCTAWALMGQSNYGMQAEQLYGALNAVKKESMIRVEADEVTYPLHIILRSAQHHSLS